MNYDEMGEYLNRTGDGYNHDGVMTRVYCGPRGRLEILVCNREIHLQRRHGIVGAGMWITREELGRLNTLLAKVAAWASGWAEIPTWRSPPHPLGTDCATYYAPNEPHPRFDHRALFSRVNADDRAKGRELLTGRDVRRRVDPPEKVAGGFERYVRLERVGERPPVPDGVPMGECYRDATGWKIEALRREVFMKRGKGNVVLEADERYTLIALARAER